MFVRKECNPPLQTVRHLILENSIQRSFQNFKMCSIMHSKLKTSQSLPDGLGSDVHCTPTNFLWGKTFKTKNCTQQALKCFKSLLTQQALKCFKSLLTRQALKCFKSLLTQQALKCFKSLLCTVFNKIYETYMWSSGELLFSKN